MDREADDFEILALLSSLRTRFVIRVQHNRRLENGHLREVAEATDIRAEREVALSKRVGKAGPKQRKIHPARKSRTAQLAIAATRVRLLSNPRAAASSRETLELNVVRVWEPEPPEGEAPVDWLLYTSEQSTRRSNCFELWTGIEHAGRSRSTSNRSRPDAPGPCVR